MNATTPIQYAADARQACELLCIDFANAIDAQDYSRVTQLFAPDAVILSEGRTVQGQEAIGASLNARPADMVTRHFCTNIRVTPESPDTATGVSYVVCYKVRGEAPDAKAWKTPDPIVGEYFDKYVRTAQGWRIQERRIAVVFDPQDAPQ
ncbi:nuclear transport factor 2 family protein [Pandoraea pulmonicola]|uniref:SnoaL-like domain-containing protein n=1 Tax=Pandoraea pulmonicola TaxID=93221 RepID=A0AAJ4ZG93_PANPU|nr:nuclear transport factor 2 family protein [Pandoraea pulmonicola]APD13573.1 hypothetical protein RO07_25565 [Pandoraea pulmonicola]SUA92772.1 Uncharacterised protein [Pandoraea pulmonicola]